MAETNTPGTTKAVSQARKLPFWWKAIALTLALILLVLYFLLFTRFGAQFVAGQLNRNIESLAIKEVEGALFSNLTLTGIELNTDDLQVSVAKVAFEIRPFCLLSGEVCIESALLHKPAVHVMLPSESSQVDDHNETTEQIELPLPVLVNSLLVDDFELTLLSKQDPHRKIHINNQQLHLRGFRFYKGVDIASLALHRLTVEQLSDKDPAAAQPEDKILDLAQIRDWQYQPIQLSPLHIPVELSVKSLTVSEFDFQSDGQSLLSVNRLESAIVAGDSGVKFDVASLQMPDVAFQAELELTAQWQMHIAFNGERTGNISQPLTILGWQVIGSSPETEYAFTKLQLDMTGSLDDMQLSARIMSSTDAEVISATAQLNPAQPLLPVNIDLNWQELTLQPATPEATSEAIHFRKGQVHIAGDVNEYQLSLNSENDSPIANEVFLSSVMKFKLGDSKSFTLKEARLDSQFATIDVSGDAHLQEELAFQSELTIAEARVPELLQALSPEAAKQLPEALVKPLEKLDFQGKVKLTGKLTENSHLHPQLFSATGEIVSTANWLARPLTLHSHLALSIPVTMPDNLQLELSQMRLALGDNQLDATAAIDASSITTDVIMEVEDLSQILPKGAGSASLKFTASGPMTKPNINSRLQASNLKWLHYTAENIAFESVLDWEQSKAFKLEGEVVQARFNDIVFSTRLNTAGDIEDHQIAISVTSDELKSELELSGGFTDSRWQGELLAGELEFAQFRFVADAQTDFSFGWSPASLSVSPHCWRHRQAALCTEMLTFSNNQLLTRISGQNLPVKRALKRLLPELQALNTSSELEFDSRLQWHLSELPQWHITGALSAAQWQLGEEIPAVNVEKLIVTSNSQSNRVETNVELSGPELGSINSQVNLLLPQQLSAIKLGKDTNVTVETQLDISGLDISPFLLLLPQLQSGQGIIDGSLRGSWLESRPELAGTLRLSNGDIVSQDLGLHLSNVNQSITFEQNKASILGEFSLGGGQGNLLGELNWRNTPSINLTVTGNELGFQDGEQFSARFSPDLAINASAGGAELSGTLALSSALVKLKSLPESVALPSSDVVFVDVETANKASHYPVNLSLDVIIDPQKNKQVKLEAFGLSTGLQGALSIEGSTKKLSATGEINLHNGRYQAWGQQLLIQDGELRFTGPVEEPFLYTRAIRDPAYTADNVIAGLLVEGQARNPRVSIYSEPAMSQAQALSYLTRGKSLKAKSTESDEAVLTSMLLNFGLSKSENRIGSLGKKVGVDDLSVDMLGQGDNTTVAISGSLSDRVKVSYGVGVFSAISEVSLRLQLLPELYLEAVSGLTNAVDVYYQFDDGETKDSPDAKPEKPTPQ